MKYEYSLTEIGVYDKKGKVTIYAICNVCKKRHKNDFGYKLKMEMHYNSSAYHSCLCKKCAEKIIPILKEAVDKIHVEEEKIKNTIPHEEKKRREKFTDFDWSNMSNITMHTTNDSYK